jgi:alkanesulfonate monooxygenase SsuD/methylene tetrahydromethanopterin reductase-like flavin-dependent oxidoreductase (luciferase family)
MQFGLLVASAFPGRAEVPAREAFNFAMALCDTAHRSGFSAIGAANKYLAGPAHQFFHPMIMAGHIFAKWPDMQVVTTIFILPYANPVAVAEQIATLDMMAPGKLVFGVGGGYRRDESVAFRVPNNERGRRMAESIAAMRQLWREGTATFRGEFWEFENADIGTKPVNGKGPTILIAADTVRTVGLIPERGGDYWYPSMRASKKLLREAIPVYREALERRGRPFTGLPLVRDICVAENKAAAEALVRKSLTDYLHQQSAWGQPGENYLLNFDELKRDRLILGTSVEAAEEIIKLSEEFGSQFIMFRIYSSGMDEQRALDVVRQVGEEVLPMVQRECGAASMF